MSVGSPTAEEAAYSEFRRGSRNVGPEALGPERGGCSGLIGLTALALVTLVTLAPQTVLASPGRLEISRVRDARSGQEVEVVSGEESWGFSSTEWPGSREEPR